MFSLEDILRDLDLFNQYEEFIDNPYLYYEYVENNNGDDTGYEEYILNMFNSYNW